MEQAVAPSLPTTRAAVVAAARGWIGTPYRHQASLRGVGCDCLGLVRGVWREALAEAAFRHLAPVALDDFAAGDVLLFRWRSGFVAKHAAIASSAATMIHAHDGAAVCEVALAPWWRRRIAYAFRFPGVL